MLNVTNGKIKGGSRLEMQSIVGKYHAWGLRKVPLSDGVLDAEGLPGVCNYLVTCRYVTWSGDCSSLDVPDEKSRV